MAKKATKFTKKTGSRIPSQPLTDHPDAGLGKDKPLSGLTKKLAEAKKAEGNLPPHVIVIARAGTGKTTTLVEGLKRLRGLPVRITPSPQQQAVWDAISLSKPDVSVCFAAFNKSIAVELQSRVPSGCDAMTMHSLGFRAVTAAFPQLRGRKLNEYRTQDLLAEIMGMDIREIRKRKNGLIQPVEQLVRLSKMNLTEGTAEAVAELVSHYDIEMEGFEAEVFDLVPRILEACLDPNRGGMIDFSDMIWLPIALDLPVNRYDLLLVDEAQDLNRCQQALARKAGRRLILCGDPKQAIYGFAGADAESMNRMERELSGMIGDPASGRCVLLPAETRCLVLPLTVTRRCGKAIVAEAKKIVPEFEAHESNPEGVISQDVYEEEGLNNTGQQASYHSKVQPGDFLLCRVNAPLVSQCFRFLRAGRKATIQGRDIGQGLISMVKKLWKDGMDVVGFSEALENWLNLEVRKENAKRNPSENRLIALQDKYDCLLCFAGSATADTRREEVLRKIESIFTDDKDCPGIRLSSVHKAKGLEAKRVFILQPKGASIPHPMAKTAWQREQENNLLYVAITRAIEELTYVY